jgi:3-phosphoshikimate 1-carboxyvinyltransferase
LANALKIKKTPVIRGEASRLPASKSISNRALIINAMAGGSSALTNLSDANDTRLMQRLIHEPGRNIDVEDAGTTMRFLTAYFAVTNQHKVLTGTLRMKERPIGILVDALRTVGASIEYLDREGYPPHETKGFPRQTDKNLRIRGDVSSQYISALMMVAPSLPEGLSVEFVGKVGSRPYIEMTAALMQHFGVQCQLTERTVTIRKQSYQANSFTVESDWSAASYWFALVALAREASISLPRLTLPSLQGDHQIVEIMKALGVHTTQLGSLLSLHQSPHQNSLSWDFTHCPDLAQTVCVVCAAKGITGQFTGLESLRIKETDRIAALQVQLGKIGADLIEEDRAHWTLRPSAGLPDSVVFDTYEDHRMAMAFAPLATLMDVTIDEPNVVRKSYPNYWNDLQSVGFPITFKEGH